MYSGRTILPAKFTGLRVSVINTDSRPQILKQRTNLGDLERINTVDRYSETATIGNDPSGVNIDVVQQMMDGLPAEL